MIKDAYAVRIDKVWMLPFTEVAAKKFVKDNQEEHGHILIEPVINLAKSLIAHQEYEDDERD